MGNLIIKNNNTTRTYKCQTTHTTPNYLVVDKNNYLNLTTATTTGIQMKLKINNENYRPMQTYTSTSSRSSQYISTSGYSGYTSTSSSWTYSSNAYIFTKGTYTFALVKASLSTSASQKTGIFSVASSQTESYTSYYNGIVSYSMSFSSNTITSAQSWSGTKAPSSNRITFTGPTNLANAALYKVARTFTLNVTSPKMTVSHTLAAATKNWLSLLSSIRATFNNTGQVITTTNSSSSQNSISSTLTSANWFSTAALTKTTSRSSQYNITTEI